MWTILVWALAIVDGSLQTIAVFETKSEFTSRQSCEAILYNPEIIVQLPHEFDVIENGVVDIRGACVPIGKLSSYM